MNDLKDFDFYCDYAYTYCACHLEEDGWSRKEFGNATELYKKKLKALEIINEKEVDIFYIKMCFSEFYGFENYNQSRSKEKQLTREEYELFKEVLS